MDTRIRPVLERDLQAITRTWLAAEGEDATAGQPTPSVLPHLLRTGVLMVAEQEGEISGFASAFTRDRVTFLGQMFINPRRQSSGTGRALLQAVMPDDGTVRATVASPDPRAVSLYVRHGMQPAWPVFDLAVDVSAMRELPESMVRLLPADQGDPDLVDLDAVAGGRRRSQDHAYWVSRRGGTPFWCERGGLRVGYAYLQVQRNSTDPAWDSGHVRVGPLGVTTVRDAFDCVLAAVGEARAHGNHLSVLMPGPHPALGAILGAGFRIRDIETFLTSAQPPFVDGALYVPSGGGLF